ncbi:MAG: hypothetical protein H0V54_14495 [Chthoniobacterales bacterium]|nr:hypothetical protein [Chthoniobacterales bacterium]
MEVTLALGIASFCLIAVFGLLPVGVQSNQAASSQTAAASILRSVVADLRVAAPGGTSPQYAIPIGTNTTLFLDGNGTLVDVNQARYRVTVVFPPTTANSFFTTIKLSWPAPADPSTVTPAGYVETFAALNRS